MNEVAKVLSPDVAMFVTLKDFAVPENNMILVLDCYDLEVLSSAVGFEMVHLLETVFGKFVDVELVAVTLALVDDEQCDDAGIEFAVRYCKHLRGKD